LYRRLGGPLGRSGQVRKISPPPGFDSRTVQAVASRYTDYATQPVNKIVDIWKKNLNVTFLTKPVMRKLRRISIFWNVPLCWWVSGFHCFEGCVTYIIRISASIRNDEEFLVTVICR
jgi:hypothetical protein